MKILHIFEDLKSIKKTSNRVLKFYYWHLQKENILLNKPTE